MGANTRGVKLLALVLVGHVHAHPGQLLPTDVPSLVPTQVAHVSAKHTQKANAQRPRGFYCLGFTCVLVVCCQRHDRGPFVLLRAVVTFSSNL